MRKIGMFVAAAAVVSYAGAAKAQVTAVVNATAELEATLTITASDAIFNCGLVAVGTDNCGGPGTGVQETDDQPGEVTVTSNSNWSLSIADVGNAAGECASTASAPAGSTANVVTLCNNETGKQGFFQVDLAYTSSCAEAATALGAGDEVITAATATNACAITIDEDATTPTISGLTTADGYGVYTGSIVVTLTGT